MSNTNKEEFLSKKDLYERYWKCRDFELSTLWQRAAFLGPILVLIFTGYGAFFAKCFIGRNGILHFSGNIPFERSHVFAAAIAIMGVVFSILWICMMKGSKAWYEVYERAILAMDTQKDWIFDKELLECGAGFKQHRLPGYKLVRKNDEPQFCDSLLSSKGGCYSPSKINIVIGQVSFLFWLLVAFFHVSACIGVLVKNGLNPALIAVVLETLTIIFVIYMVFKPKSEKEMPWDFWMCGSNSLRNRDPGVYSQNAREERIYTLRIVDRENKIEELIKYPVSVGSWTLTGGIEKNGNMSLNVVLDKDFERWAEYPCYASVNFEAWCLRKNLSPSTKTAMQFIKEEIKPIFESFRKEVY